MPSAHNLAQQDHEELRIALVMNGGVSLAVWIGGVTHEVNRAMRGEGLYAELLELTATTARIDVISGASAGGINGALLALALTCDASLSPMRDVWLQRGSLERLLRSPYDANPSSLLRGNERFFEDLRSAFTDIRGAGSVRSPAEMPLDLTLTTTMLHGVPNRIVDDLGVIVGDVSHRGRFEFRRGADLAADPFADKDIVDRLALASRASASFPVAFEPVFCPIAPDRPLDDSRLVDMDGLATFGQSRFLLDGGILDNKPLESAIRAVFRQRAEREVRRVLAYVIPAPGQTAAERADDVNKVPTLGEVALASLIELPRVESISAQLESILEHNRLVRRKRDTRTALVRELRADGVRALATDLFSVYRKRRLESAADYIADELSAGLAKRKEQPVSLGRRGRDWLARVVSGPTAIPWVPTALPAESPTLDEAAVDHWGWGAITVEHIAEIVLDLFRRALTVAPLYQSPDPALRERLRRRYAAGHDLLAATPAARTQDRDFWATRVEGLADILKNKPEAMAQAAVPWANDCVRGWSALVATLTVGDEAQAFAPRPLPAGEVPRAQALGWVAATMAALIAEAAVDIRNAARAGETNGRTEADKEFARDLGAYIDYLAPDGGTAAIVLSRLLTLEVVQYATGTHREVPDQFVELVQISANAPNAFGGPSSASEKLAGAQLGNFGGFYKKAWRANDWMYGRMDGADRLVRILLNPARLARLYANDREKVVQALRAIAIGSAGTGDTRDALEAHWRAQEPLVRDELTFLERTDIPVPEQLPHTAQAVVGRLHLSAMREELPIIVGAAKDDRRTGAGTSGASADLIAAAEREIGAGGADAWARLPTEKLVSLFRNARIGEERFGSEVGTDLFTSRLTQSLAVAVTMVSGPRAGLGALGRVLQAVRLPMLIVDALAQNAVTQSRTAAFVSGIVLALSGTIVAVGLLADPVLPLSLVAAASVAFVASVALLLRRRPRLMVLWLVVAVAAWALPLARSWWQ